MKLPKIPLIGFVVIEEYAEDFSHWDGAIAYPDPTGANLAWENPIPFIEKSFYDQLQRKLINLADAAEDARERIHSEICMTQGTGSCCAECAHLTRLLSS